MKAEIVATGTELLLGQTLNTSAHYITGRLSSLGIEVDFHVTVGDNPERIEDALRTALQRSDLLVTTGGLGPTVDDLTKELVAKVFGLEMVLDQTSLEQIKAFFAKRRGPMPVGNEKQAYFPKGAKILPNPIGTAPGAVLEKDGKMAIILPGPPFEMEPMFENHVWPVLLAKVGPDAERMNVRVLKVFGMGESAIEEVLGDLMQQTNPTMALLAKRSEMHIRLVARSSAEAKAKRLLDKAEEEIRVRLGSKVFGKDRETMVGLVGEALRRRGLTIATAESCTGGLLGGMLTQEPGSSAFYLGGVISYANAVKENLLGVESQTLALLGAVSPEVATAMALGVQSRTGAHLALATTGIAGPDGGTPDKPVGLVYIGFATPEGVKTQKLQFYGERESVRQLTVKAALDWVRRYLLIV